MATGYKFLQTIADWTIPNLSAGETLTINAQGYAGGTNYNTTDGPTSTVASPYVNEIVSIEITSPTDVNGNYEGGITEIWFNVNGNNSLQHFLNLPMSGWVNMMPPHENVYGGRDRAIVLGKSFLQVCMEARNQDGSVRPVTNMPLHNTTIKYAGDFSVQIKTQSGWTGAGNGGLRIVAKGYRYDLEDLQFLGRYYQGTIFMDTEGRETQNLGPLALTYPVPAFTKLSDFEALPGGIAQKAKKVNPMWNFSYNGQATQRGSTFVLSANTAIPGAASGNVYDTFQDLGFPFAGTQNAVIIRGMGVQPVTRPSYLERVGWLINGTNYPANNGGPGVGQYASDAVNNLVFGDPGYYVPGAGTNHQLGLYEPVPRIQGEGLLIYGTNAAPWIASQAGNPIPQYAVVVGLNGVLIEQ